MAGTAQTGDQALALVEKLSPDLVITDIRMPVMDGITLLTKVREQFPFTKFIITSGFSDFEYAKKAITLKVSDYLLKPVDSEELKEALSKIKQEFQIAGNDYEEVFNDPDCCHDTSPDCHITERFHCKKLQRGH